MVQRLQKVLQKVGTTEEYATWQCGAPLPVGHMAPRGTPGAGLAEDRMLSRQESGVSPGNAAERNQSQNLALCREIKPSLQLPRHDLPTGICSLFHLPSSLLRVIKRGSFFNLFPLSSSKASFPFPSKAQWLKHLPQIQTSVVQSLPLSEI